MKQVQLFAAVLSFLLAFLSPSFADEYTVTCLDLLSGDNTGGARGINNSGQIVGWSGSTKKAVIWENGSITQLPTLSGFVRSAARGINANGDVVGYCTTSDGHDYATLWSSGVASSLGTFAAAPDDRSTAYGINDSGVAVGWSRTDNGLTQGVRWNGGPPPQAVPGVDYAYGINDSGTVVGMFLSNSDSQYHACVYKNSVFTDLGAPATHGCAYDINDLDKIAGQCWFPSTDSYNWHAAIWVNGVATDLGNLGRRSEAWAINEHDQVVGWYYSSAANDYRAFLWENNVMTDLNSLIPSDSGWVLRYAYDINDNGSIVGEGTYNGHEVPFLLTIPEPATLALLAVGGIALLRQRRGRG